MLLINGLEVEFQNNLSLYDLLKKENFNPDFVACEVNKELVKREDFKLFIVKDGYTIEVFSFVGGG
ncbi:sulfur carrier protein ThiS [Anaerococcus sp. AGMB00486]|uniref:Sulfur carrier protein ThiS n=2 Tax=Anaerococcus TaxID=165779 RepID=A0ABX2NCE5_9FIRM|nr:MULTISPECIES: sulfur carrier protein ThiS [Anaerococcus]MDY3006499.1 sulfur carrier protein ThiS [Anaerococcus porci]MSS77885.1 sulfur carrier protein ThiS [Anaerococcus porci]NVF12363.1 sulfur carrier protein ThiS [Anaerococcus faecalis]